MEFLDPKHQRAHTIRLLFGYVLIAIALALATTILIYQANGFGFKDGQVIQNGFVFMSSSPSAATIYMNGQRADEQTNTRLTVPAGQYTFSLQRDGYRGWRRAINVEGGAVQRFDYPFLVPNKLVTTAVKKYDVVPGLQTQSPDRRWLMVAHTEAFGIFDLFDTDQDKPVPVSLKIPEDLLATATGAHSWKLVEWASDNRHVLLQHIYGVDGKQGEYILVDRQDPPKSVNITTLTGLNPTIISLRDKAYDDYYLFDANAGNLFTASLKKPTPQIYLQHVLAFKAHDDSRLLYASSEAAPSGKAIIRLKEDDQTYTLRTVPAGTTYLLDLARYEGDWYVVAGAQNENRTYVYKNPADSLHNKPEEPLVPVQILKTLTPTKQSFSANSRFVMTENGSAFAVYDAENDRGYKYDLKLPIDSASGHAVWMDGHRLSVISANKHIIFEFDDANQETLGVASPAFLPVFDREYKYTYAITAQTTKAADGKETTAHSLTRTALRTPEDL